ncbi:MAG TPA: NrfD/PsrC family molybdoenzyme membrane anchor subunit [Candidatus Limnocylindrales bacterium]
MSARTLAGGRVGGLPRPSRILVAWLAFLAIVFVAGLAAWGYQMANGLRVTAMRNTVMWGQYILFFMFFVGLSAGGLIVASAGRLFGVARFRPIVRLAVLEATVAVMLAALFLWPDIGRPERIWHLFVYPNPTSPMIWDIAIVTVYFVVSTTYVFLYTRHDLAAAGSPLALGTKATPAGLRRDDRLKGGLAWIALPAAILLHSITAWIFGLQISRGFWYTAIMAPLFISSALVSGLALVILLALAVRRTGRLTFGDDLVAWLGGMLCVFVAVEAFFVLSESLTAAYPGAAFEADPIGRLVAGPYAPLFAFEVVVGLGLPFVLLAVRPLRTRVPVVALASVVAIVGIFVHRLNIVLNGLSYPPIGLPPGVPIGIAPAAGSTAFAESYWYVPSLVEWLVVGGVLAFGGLVFTVATLILPLREADHG